MNPWLTIVIPSIGKRDGLRRTLDSIFHQSLDSVEALVVADTFQDAGDQVAAAVRDTVIGYPGVYPEGFRFVTHDAGLHCYGQPQRTYGAQMARGDWVAFSQDDNILAKDALNAIWFEVCHQTHKRPLFFKMQTFWRQEVWTEPMLRQGDIDADCIVLPQRVAGEVEWGLRYEGDFDVALAAMRMANGDVGWCEERIAIARPEGSHIWW